MRGCVPLLIMPDAPLDRSFFRSGRSSALPLLPRWLSTFPSGLLALRSKYAGLPARVTERLPFARWAYLQLSMRAMLPFGRWIDYCDVAMIVPASVASTRLDELVAQLAHVPAHTLERKARAARRLRQIFAFHPPSREGNNAEQFVKQITEKPPTRGGIAERGIAADARSGAVDFLLAELCDAARHMPPNDGNVANASVQTRLVLGQATRLERCILLA
mmetsp:Transcript_26141/g.52415  ORF Transcript_26141/g.52415 Transcript_26141/m.52415 type:complete len:218 (-) Transcript_26141:167-820(-)